MKRTIGLTLVLLAVLSAACTNKQGETESPVFITVDLQAQPGFVNVAVPLVVQLDTIILNSSLKNPNDPDPQGFADVTIENYTVVYRRTDGGTLVPPVQTFGGGVVVPSGGQATLNNFPILNASAVQGTPFDQLLPFNGGIDRETGKAEISTAFDITFFGHTVSGKRVQSETASGLLIFSFDGGAAGAGTSR
jgi:hypothetical protein